MQRNWFTNWILGSPHHGVSIFIGLPIAPDDIKMLSGHIYGESKIDIDIKTYGTMTTPTQIATSGASHATRFVVWTLYRDHSLSFLVLLGSPHHDRKPTPQDFGGVDFQVSSS